MSFAMGYALKKRAKKACYGGKMADGGLVDEEAEYDPKEEPGVVHDEPAMEEDDLDLGQHGADEEGPESDVVGRVIKQFAKGGMIDEDSPADLNFADFASSHPEYSGSELPSDIEGNLTSDEDNADSVMHKAAGGLIDRIMRKHYSKGGQVANDVGVAEADKLPAEYDDLVLRDDDMEDADYTGANSGDELSSPGEDERRKDIIARIMKSRAKKDRMPRPA